jgi:hypothetical protein
MAYQAAFKKELSSVIETRIVPIMDCYFQSIMEKLADLTKQGIDYYNLKLSNQTQLFNKHLGRVL